MPDDQDDFISRPEDSERKRGIPAWGWLLIVGAVSLLLCGSVGVVGAALMWTVRSTPPAEAPRPVTESAPKAAESKAKAKGIGE